jgi:hypothetical protein
VDEQGTNAEDLKSQTPRSQSVHEDIFLTHNHEKRISNKKDIREYIVDNIWGITSWVRDVNECQPLASENEKSQRLKKKKGEGTEGARSEKQERIIFICHEGGFLVDFPNELVQNLSSQIGLLGSFANVRKTLEKILGIYDVYLIRELQPFTGIVKKSRLGVVYNSSEKMVTILISGDMTVRIQNRLVNF